MLSICIPVYNYDVSNLVIQLDAQCSKLEVPYEILVLEDGSDIENVNHLDKYRNLIHIVNKDNYGRSKARNILAENASYEKILFLDCDSETPSSDFITLYLKVENCDVLCGGTIYKQKQYVKELSLRYWYGVKREMVDASQRNSNADQSFTTNNFLIKKSIFDTIKFREFLTKYGHEDSLFGYELKKNNILIEHINNPVIHIGLESNQVFLEKTNQAIDNIVLIEDSNNIDAGFTAEISLVRAYYRLKKSGLKALVKLIFHIFEKMIKNHLLNSTKPSMILFDVYKLSYYCKIKDHEEKIN